MIDLHSHTTASDGEKTPEELIDLALSKKLSAIAITDHDTISGLKSAFEYSKDKNIIFVPGVELEADVDKGQMHILGLFIDFENKELNNMLDKIKQGRINRNNLFLQEFNKMGFEITLEDLQKVSGGKIIGKPHFAKVFLQKNYIHTKSDIFDNYFNKPPLCLIKKTRYTPEVIIKLIKKSNGIAVLAHPQSLKLEDNELEEKIKELISFGLDGLECYHSNQTLEQMQKYKALAKKFNLLVTKGSDYHGPITKPDVELAVGKNGNIVSDDEDEILKKLLNYKNISYVNDF